MQQLLRRFTLEAVTRREPDEWQCREIEHLPRCRPGWRCRRGAATSRPRYSSQTPHSAPASHRLPPTKHRPPTNRRPIAKSAESQQPAAIRCHGVSGTSTVQQAMTLIGTNPPHESAFGTKRPWVRIPPPRPANSGYTEPSQLARDLRTAAKTPTDSLGPVHSPGVQALAQSPQRVWVAVHDALA
jgi:hypothetical protein